MEWVSANKKLPEKSGAYLTISRYGEFMVLPYSVKHKAFNAYDHSTEEYVAKHKKAGVSCWIEIPPLPEEYYE